MKPQLKRLDRVAMGRRVGTVAGVHMGPAIDVETWWADVAWGDASELDAVPVDRLRLARPQLVRRRA